MSSSMKDARWFVAMRTCREVLGKDLADPTLNFNQRQSMLTAAQTFLNYANPEQVEALGQRYDIAPPKPDGTDMSWTEEGVWAYQNGMTE